MNYRISCPQAELVAQRPSEKPIQDEVVKQHQDSILMAATFETRVSLTLEVVAGSRLWITGSFGLNLCSNALMNTERLRQVNTNTDQYDRVVKPL